MTVEYLVSTSSTKRLSDHLNSTSLTTDTSGAKVLELRYKAWGEVRASSLPSENFSSTTDPIYKAPSYTYTGQYSYMDDPTTSGVTEGFGLMFYNARWYDPALGRFAQADTVIPSGVQGLDRYAYSFNNPVQYTDPTGHWPTTNPFQRYFEAVKVLSYIAVGGMPTFRALLQGGLDQKSHMDITGTGLTEIRADSDVINKKNEMIDNVKNNPLYGQKAFSKKDDLEVHLAEHGSLVDDMHDETFFTVHEGTLSAEMNVSKNGTIKAVWQVSDNFDYRPHWDTPDKRSLGSYLTYNILAEVVGGVYHDILGATDDMTTSATWTETIYPDKDDLQYQRGR